MFITAMLSLEDEYGVFQCKTGNEVLAEGHYSDITELLLESKRATDGLPLAANSP